MHVGKNRGLSLPQNEIRAGMDTMPHANRACWRYFKKVKCASIAKDFGINAIRGLSVIGIKRSREYSNITIR
jgi:hypothetical protein